MSRKHDTARPYPPDLCSRATLAYRLDITADTVTDWVRLGHLPPPIEVGTQQRWPWAEVLAFIAARNGRGMDGDGPAPVPSQDPFLSGVRNAKAAHA